MAATLGDGSGTSVPKTVSIISRGSHFAFYTSCKKCTSRLYKSGKRALLATKQTNVFRKLN